MNNKIQSIPPIKEDVSVNSRRVISAFELRKAFQGWTGTIRDKYYAEPASKISVDWHTDLNLLYHRTQLEKPNQNTLIEPLGQIYHSGTIDNHRCENLSGTQWIMCDWLVVCNSRCICNALSNLQFAAFGTRQMLLKPP